MKFNYYKTRDEEEIAELTEEELREHDKKIYKPSLLVCLRHKTRFSRKCFGLIDTGADMVTAGYKFAYDLGLDPLSGKEDSIQGAWGIIPQYICEDIEVVIIKDAGLRTLSFETRIAFCEAVGDRILLGREGFFDNFKIVIDERRREVELIRPKSW